jgi:hypothetical protein
VNSVYLVMVILHLFAVPVSGQDIPDLINFSCSLTENNVYLAMVILHLFSVLTLYDV